MPAGRPPKFDSSDAMQEVIDKYFATDAFMELNGETVFAPTISGLALSLGMTTASLRNYSEREEFFSTVKCAKQRVEQALEQRLYGTAVTGSIFNLKNNFGWKDKSEQEISGPDGGPQKHSWTVEVINAPNDPK